VRARLAALAAIGGLVVLAVPGNAATAKPQIVDPAGDANGINGQGLVVGLPNVSTGPAQMASADIQKVLFQTTFVTKRVNGVLKKVPTGFTVTMTLGGAPLPETFYRITTTASGCGSLWFEYGTDVTQGGTTVRCLTEDLSPTAKDKVYKVPEATVKGSSIIWKIAKSQIPVGTSLSELAAQTRLNPAVITAPSLDETSLTNSSYIVGK
jgi:hypothetical protein